MNLRQVASGKWLLRVSSRRLSTVSLYLLVLDDLLQPIYWFEVNLSALLAPAYTPE